MLKRFLLVSLAIFFALATVAVVAVQYQKQPQVLVVTDDTQQELQFFELPERVVVLEPGTAQLLQRWQRENLVVATSGELIPLFPLAENLGPRQEITPLQIAATRPDLIITGALDTTLVQELRQAGFPVLTVAPDRLSRLLVWPEALGSLLAANQQAAQFTRQLEKQFTEFQSAAAEQPGAGRRVLWLVDDQFTVAGSSTLEADLIDLVGAVNVVANLDGYTALDPVEIASLATGVVIAPEALLPPISTLLQREQLEAVEPPNLVPLQPQSNVISWDNIFARANWLLENLPIHVPVEE